MEKLMRGEDLTPEEMKKIKELLKKDSKGSKSSDGGKLDWMYNKDSGKPNNEDYLLGKEITKLGDEEDRSHFDIAIPGTISANSITDDVLEHNAAVDLQVKIREDPLFAIRKKEEDQRRRLLMNPVKMKQLQKMIEEKQKSEKKKKKKDKKHKKHKHKSGSDSDDDIVQKYLAILSKKEGKNTKIDSSKLRKLSAASESDSDSESHHNVHSKGSHKRRKEVRSVERTDKHSRRHDSSSDSDGNDKRPHGYGLLKAGSSVQPSKTKMSESPRRAKSKSPSRRRSRSPITKTKRRSRSPQRKNSRYRSTSRSPVRRSSRSPRRRSRSVERKRQRQRSASKSPVRKRSRSPYRKRSKSPKRTDRNRNRSPEKKHPVKKKLTTEEMERRREEMMSNAKWRDQQRSTNVERYKDEDTKEEESLFKEGSSADFLNPLLTKHAEASSVEDRLKRNKYNIQRTKAALDKNFTKH